MVRRTLTVKVKLEGVRETLAVLRVLPAEAKAEMKQAVDKISAAIAVIAVGDISAHGGAQGPLLAPTVKKVAGVVPAVQVGGTSRVGRKGAPAYGVLFGSVFGAFGRYGWFGEQQYHGAPARQYRPHHGAAAYAFFPLLESQSAVISRYYQHAADRVVQHWTENA